MMSLGLGVIAVWVLFILFLLQTKHLLIDWIWQPPYEWQNKGTYGHFGGIRHALKNALGTGLCIWVTLFAWIKPEAVLWLTFLDFVIHYHIDWAKMNLNRKLGYGPTTHAEFWWLTGFDQYLHQVTYLGLVLYALFLIS